MTDVEYVLRYLTLRETWNRFSGDFRSSMDTFMHYHIEANDPDLAMFSHAFARSLDACEKLWGTHAFKRPDRGAWRDQALAGMYDSQMVAVSLLSDDKIEKLRKKKNAALDVVQELFEDAEFEDAVRVATNTPSRVRYRVSEMKRGLSAAAG
jgi:hypothetical protein